MDKRLLILFVCVVIAAGLVSVGMAAKGGNKAKPQCNDGSDNDGDGYTDWPNDPGCANKNDQSELNPYVECDDGTDNDGDNDIDYNDGGCSGPTDEDETNCGDDVCEGGETCSSCEADCGPCNSCGDTDGGRIYDVAGTVSGYRFGTPYSYDDFCLPVNATQNLIEYFCAGDMPLNEEHVCPTTCTNGACD